MIERSVIVMDVDHRHYLRTPRLDIKAARDVKWEVQELLVAMHKILNPGEYGLGTEPESVPYDEKEAWEHLGRLRDQLERLLTFSGE